MNDNREEKSPVRMAVDMAVNANAGPVWKGAEDAWKAVQLPEGYEIHHLQVVYVTRKDVPEDDARIMGVSFTGPPDLTPNNISYLLAAVLAQIKAYQVKPVHEKATRFDS